MKKLCIFAFALALASCSSSDDSSSSPSTVLLKKTIEDYGGGDVLTSVYTYNGTKLVKIVSDDDTENYTYTGNLITKIDYVEDGDVVARETFSYNANEQLIGYTYADIDSDYGNRETYVWNSATSVSLTSYNGNATSQTNTVGTGTITLVDGEVTAVTTDYGEGFTFTYDSKNNPTKNITGFGKIPFAGIDASGTGMHNILTAHDNTSDSTYSATFTYNANDYPSADNETDDGGTDPINTQYFYN